MIVMSPAAEPQDAYMLQSRFYLSPHSPPAFEVVLTRSGRFHIRLILAINQALPDDCSFVIYGHPGGSAAGDITIIWNDVLKYMIDWCTFVAQFIYFLLLSPSHGGLSFLKFENLFAIFTFVCNVF